MRYLTKIVKGNSIVLSTDYMHAAYKLLKKIMYTTKLPNNSSLYVRGLWMHIGSQVKTSGISTDLKSDLQTWLYKLAIVPNNTQHIWIALL